jgi:hypothetical protein
MTQAADTKQKPRKVRGTALIDPTDYSFEFTPYQEAPSTQKDVKTCRAGGKSWTTTGADPSKVIHLMCKESAADPYAELAAQFKALTKDLKPKNPLLPPDSQRVVVEDGLQCWVNEEKNEMTFTGKIDLSKHSRDWQAEVLRQVQLIVRRLPASERFNKLVSNIKNSGGTKK